MNPIDRINIRATMNAKLVALRQQKKLLQQQLRVSQDNERQLMALADELYKEIEAKPALPETVPPKEFDGITFIVAAYNMERQLKRTLQSLTPQYQKALPRELEIIVVDNGSEVPLAMEAFRRFPRVTKIIRVEGKPSPVFGLNQAVQEASFSNIALMIDGAHLLSPGIYENAKAVFQMMPRPVINIPQFILGDISQNLRTSGNAFEREEEKLQSLNWPNRGYSLFEYALVAGEHRDKDFYASIESNCLITTKEVLEECGGFEEQFDEPGAGLANIEILTRLRHHPDNQYVIIPGEGTFHQDHSGTTTSVSREKRKALVEQYFKKYEAITGHEKVLNAKAPFYYGTVRVASRSIPTISRNYGKAKGQILNQLSAIYTQRAEHNQEGQIPQLTLNRRAAEHDLRPVLPALDLLAKSALAEDVNPERLNYRNVLIETHRIVKPRFYFEIGIDRGDSLCLADCPSVGVDPTCEISATIKSPTRIFRMESDHFFSNNQRNKNLFKHGIDLSFIDGMHLAEYVVRDFINVERWANEDAVIVLDDVYPEQLEMSERDRRFTAWCGDVYKIIPILLEYRPDLDIHVFEAFAGPYRKGLAMISNLDRNSKVLAKAYDQIEADIEGGKYDISSIDDLEKIIPSTPVESLASVLRPNA